MADYSIHCRDAAWRPKNGDYVLGPITVTANAGRFVALVGPNGAGKSSLLNLLGGINIPRQGSVTLNGVSPVSLSPMKRGRELAYLSQDPERPFGFPVSEYIGLGRFPHVGAFGRFSKADRELVEKEMEIWGLSAFRNRSVTTLSGGEFQRVRLARALVQEPRVLLFDEPGNHLDMASRTSILQRLKREAGNGRCVLAVLHDVNDALLYADEVWLLGGGKIVSSGIPGDILHPDLLAEIYAVQLNRFVGQDGRIMLGAALPGEQANRSLPG